MMLPIRRLKSVLALACVLGSSPWLTGVSAQIADPFSAGPRWSWKPSPGDSWVPTSIAMTDDGQFVWSAPAFGSARLALHSSDELASGPPIFENDQLGPLSGPPIVAAGSDARTLVAALQSPSPIDPASRVTRIEHYDAFAAAAQGAFLPNWTRTAPFETDGPAFLGAPNAGSLVVWAGWDASAATNQVEWLDAQTGAVVGSVAFASSRLRTFGLSADAERVAVTAGTELFVLERTSGTLFQTNLAVATNALAFAADGRSVLVGDLGGIRRFQQQGVGGWSMAGFLSAGPGEVATRAALSADGSIQAVAWWNALTGSSVRLEWSVVATSTSLGTLNQSGAPGGVQNFPAALGLTADGQRVGMALWGAGDTRPEVVLLDAQAAAPIVSTDLGSGSALGLAISADGTRVAAATKDVHANTFGSFGAVRLFDTGERDLQLLSAPLASAPLDLAAERPGAKIVLFLVGQPAAVPTPYPFLGGTLHLERSSGLRVYARPADASGRANLTLPSAGAPAGSGPLFGIQVLFRSPGSAQLSSAWVAPALL